MAGSVGIGAFYNPHLAPVLLECKEITHLALADAPAPHDPWWPQIKPRFTLLLHDYLGQLSEPLQEQELSRARDLLERYGSPWAAEHLQRIHTEALSPAGPAYSLDYVLPPLYTEDLMEAYAHNAHALREHLGVPLALEPIPTYLSVDVPQMSEPEFVYQVLERSGCHLLLDIPHLILSARRFGRSASELLIELPLDRVIEIHVAGLAWDDDLQETWIAPVPPSNEILDLAEEVAGRATNLRAVTFDAFSPALTPETLQEAVHLLHERFGRSQG
jgi:uncharacterized protein (UPF0276 family)